MVFGIPTKTQLQNDVFCLKEERDYFQTKFLEQVSEIANLKDQLKNAKKEIDKLRHELMQQSMSNQHLEDDVEDVANGVVETMDDASSLTSVSTSDDLDKEEDKAPSALASPRSTRDTEGQSEEQNEENGDDDDDDGDDDDDDSVKGIRQSAEKLLQWANYRSSVNTMRTMSSTPEHSSVASPSDSALANSVPPLLDQVVPKTISQNSPEDEDDLLDGCSPEENRSRAALLLNQFDSVAAKS